MRETPEPTQENQAAGVGEYCRWPRRDDRNIFRVAGWLECPRCGRECDIEVDAGGGVEVTDKYSQSLGLYWRINCWGPETAECDCGFICVNESIGFTPDRWLDLSDIPEEKEEEFERALANANREDLVEALRNEMKPDQVDAMLPKGRTA